MTQGLHFDLDLDFERIEDSELASLKQEVEQLWEQHLLEVGEEEEAIARAQAELAYGEDL